MYNVIVQASKGSLRDAKNVTIKVTNKEEAGSLSLSSRQPDVGVEITATLSDPDGGVTGQRWQWARSPDGATRWSDIPAASSASYTPVLADAANFLRVTVGYEDAQGGGKSASAETSGATGVDDDGVVTLSTTQPQVGVELTASLRDPDGGVTGEAWQWARSADGATNWEDIVTATSNAYTPVAADEDNYLRATVSYTDGDGPGKSKDAVTANPVAVVENAAPVFPASETGARSVSESAAAGANIGAPVAAGDTPGDTLTYTLGGADAASFDIVATSGQLQTKAALDSAIKSSYVVTVTATDTSGASATITVTINVMAENTPPVFPASETGARSVSENASAGTNIGAPVAAEDPGDTLTYTLGGTDAASFDIVAATGQLQTKAALDSAAKSSYVVTVTATDTSGASATITVTINVVAENTPPVFPASETGARSVSENAAAGTNIGAPVAARGPRRHLDLHAGRYRRGVLRHRRGHRSVADQSSLGQRGQV